MGKTYTGVGDLTGRRFSFSSAMNHEVTPAKVED